MNGSNKMHQSWADKGRFDHIEKQLEEPEILFDKINDEIEVLNKSIQELKSVTDEFKAI